MKMDYKCVKTLSGENPNGKFFIISEGDTVRIKYDNTVDVSDWYKSSHLDNVIDARIVRISKTTIECEDLKNRGCYLTLKTKQIVEVTDI